MLRWLLSRGEVVALGGWTTGLLTADGWRHLLMPALTLEAAKGSAAVLSLVGAFGLVRSVRSSRRRDAADDDRG